MTDQPRILVVDDIQTNVELLQAVLGHLGYSLVEGETKPTEVVAHIEAFQPHLIIMDLQMPGKSGYEILAEIRQLDGPQSTTPVVVCSGDVSPETRTKAESVGASDVLAKPLDFAEVGRLVKLHTS